MTMTVGVLALIGLLLLWMTVAFNPLTGLRRRTTIDWKRLDEEMQRRHDLIPNLVLAVKAAADVEPEALIRVIEARNRTMMAGGVAQKAAEEGRLSRALQAFFAAAARQPGLSSNERITQLQQELTAIEYRLVAVAQAYNTHAAALNQVRETFPANVLAGTFRFEPATLFEITDASDSDVPPGW